MSLSEVAVRRPVATAMLFLGIVILGVISLSRLSVDLLPNISFPKLTIWTSYPDVPPVEVEELVTIAIEEVVSTIPRVRRVSSVSKEGASLVTLEFLWRTDMDIAALNVREKLDNLRWSLPRGAGNPTVLRLDPSSQPIMSLSLSGGDLVELKELARNVIKRRLEQIKGVALAAVTGGFEREIQVEVDSYKLTSLGISVEQVASSLASANRNLPGGTIRKGRYRYSLRTLGEFQEVRELEEVVISQNGNGTVIPLKDVAKVRDGFKERESMTRFNGQESIRVIITKEAGSNSVEVSKQVRGVLLQLRDEYPEVMIIVASDQAEFISEAISNVLQAVVLGGILAFLVLFFFLHDLRNPIYIFVAIPIAILATFTMMFFSGISLNMISLGGLALGVGMLVDNSIVVMENIFRHRQEGAERVTAAVQGTSEVAMPVLASTLTTISVFFPIIYVKGVAGQLFQDQSLTVTFSVLASLLVALTLLPMLASRFARPAGHQESSGKGVPDSSRIYQILFKKKQKTSNTFLHKTQSFALGPLRKVRDLFRRLTAWLTGWTKALIRFWWGALKKLVTKPSQPLFQAFDRGFDVFAQKYEGLLSWSLQHRSHIVVVTFAGLGFALLLSTAVDRQLMPKVDQGEFVLQVKMPPGTSLEATSQTASEIERLLLRQPDVASVFSQVGLAGGQTTLLLEESDLNRARLYVKLKKDAPQSTSEVMVDLKEPVNRVGGAHITFESSASLLTQFLGTTESDVAIKISGNDLELSKVLLQEVRTKVKSVHGLKDLQGSYEEGRPEIRVSVDRETAARYGLSVRRVAQFVQNRMYGSVSTQFKDFDRKIDILVRPNVEARNELRDLLDSHIHSGKNPVPLRRLIHTESTQGPTEIRREDQVRQVSLFGNVHGRSFSDVVKEIEEKLTQIKRPFDYQITVGGQREDMSRSFRSLTLAFLLAAALVYMILAAQFESLIQPFVISFAVPLAAIGVVVALFVTGQSFNVMSLIGVVVLVGIVVNDAIIKVDFINRERRRGAKLFDAIIEAGKKRLRPILMTTVTTVLALLPMALGFGEGAELRRPLAIAVIGGLLSATFLTLVVVPVIYSLVIRERLKHE